MKYLHTMVRVSNIEDSLKFFCQGLGLAVVRRRESEKGRFTLVFLAAPGDEQAQVELTYNWDPEVYTGGRNFRHLAYEGDDIYPARPHPAELGVTITRPPPDGDHALVRSPPEILVALLPRGAAL